MDEFGFILIYFFYGLAFFSMGMQVSFEVSMATDQRLQRALRPMGAFGLIHGVHEWIEMFERIALQFGLTYDRLWLDGLRLAILSFSFLSLAAFGAYLLAKTADAQRLSLLVPLGLESVWIFGLFALRGQLAGDMMDVADVWTRYSLGIPGAALAAIGLVFQQREFRLAGMVQFGRDTLWAAVAFVWYGVVGQLITRTSSLPPSTFLNGAWFAETFGFPIELFRALTAILASMFIIRFLRAFQVENDRRISALQESQLAEAHEREKLRGQLFQQVVAAQESERQRIARDLHDETGQALTAIGMGLRGLSTSIRRGHADQAISTLGHLETLAVNSLTELQRLIADLRPSHIDDLGLPAAVRWCAKNFENRGVFKVDVEVEGHEHPLDDAVKIALFRVLQESLNNIIKHARASQVNVHVIYEPTDVRLTIKDNGQGFDMHEVRNRKTGRVSLGLLGMQERAALMGGSCFIHSMPGSGTLVDIRMPYHPVGLEGLNENSFTAGR